MSGNNRQTSNWEGHFVTKRFFRSLPCGNSCAAAPPKDRKRTLRLEQLENRTLLSITLKGTVALDSAAGTPVRNAMIQAVIPTEYANEAGTMEGPLELSETAFTNQAGEFTITDTTSFPNCGPLQLIRGQAILVTLRGGAELRGQRHL